MSLREPILMLELSSLEADDPSRPAPASAHVPRLRDASRTADEKTVKTEKSGCARALRQGHA